MWCWSTTEPRNNIHGISAVCEPAPGIEQTYIEREIKLTCEQLLMFHAAIVQRHSWGRKLMMYNHCQSPCYMMHRKRLLPVQQKHMNTRSTICKPYAIPALDAVLQPHCTATCISRATQKLPPCRKYTHCEWNESMVARKPTRSINKSLAAAVALKLRFESIDRRW